MKTHHATLQFWSKTLGIVVFGAFIGIWLGHQDKGYEPSSTAVMEAVALQQGQYLPTTTQDHFVSIRSIQHRPQI